MAATTSKSAKPTSAALNQIVRQLRQQVGPTAKVFLPVSGSLASLVTFALLTKALTPKRVYALWVDHGFYPAEDLANTTAALTKAGYAGLHFSHDAAHAAAALRTATDSAQVQAVLQRVLGGSYRRVAKRLHLSPRQWRVGLAVAITEPVSSVVQREFASYLAQDLVVAPLTAETSESVRQLAKLLGLPASVRARPMLGEAGFATQLVVAAETQRHGEALRIEAEVRRKWQLAAKVLPLTLGEQGSATLAVYTRSRTLAPLLVALRAIQARFPAVTNFLLCLSATTAPRSLRVQPAALTPERLVRLQASTQALDKLLRSKRLTAKLALTPTLLPVSTTGESESVLLVAEALPSGNATELPVTLYAPLRSALTGKELAFEAVFLELTPLVVTTAA